MTFVKGNLWENSQTMIDFLSRVWRLWGRAVIWLFLLLDLWNVVIEILFNLFKCVSLRSLWFDNFIWSGCGCLFNKILIANNLKLT